MGAQWIWHRNEFEYDLYRKVMARRREQDVRANPGWLIPAVYPYVRFLKYFTCEEDIEVSICAEGEISLRVDNEPDFRHHFSGTLFLPAGRHGLLVEVYNPTGLPCLFVEGNGCESGADWTTNCGAGPWQKAACGFFDPDRGPSSYRLPVREKYPASMERTQNLVGESGRLFLFDREIFAYPVLREVRGCGVLSVTYGESREEALDGEHAEQSDLFSVPENGGNIIGPLTKAFRYVFVPDREKIEFSDFSCLEEYYPVPNRSKFQSADELLNRIYEVSLYTLELTSREFFLDGLKRDRWVWAGDTYQSEMMCLYSFYDREIIKRTLLALAGKDFIRQHVNGIMDYSFYVILAVGDYYRYTADLDFVNVIYPQLCKLLNFCLHRRNERGFMQKVGEDWVFVDWAEFPTDGELCAEQILLLESLRRMAELSDLLGKDAEEWRKTAETLRPKIDETFWSENGYCHDARRDSVTRYGGIFAVLFGLADEEKREVILRRTLLNEDVQAIKTPYMKFYEMSALAELGARGEMLDYIKSYWGSMLNEGATSFWEEYDPNVRGAEKYAMYGRRFGKSLCHSWGASPVYLVGRYLVGLSPCGAGYERFTLSPYLDGKTFFESELPAGEGFVRVNYCAESLEVYSDRADGTLKLGDDTYEICAGEPFRLTFGKGEKSLCK